MNEDEEIRRLLEEFLRSAGEVLKELEGEMEEIERGRKRVGVSKRKIRERMRMISNAIYTGEKAREGIEEEEKKLRKGR